MSSVSLPSATLWKKEKGELVEKKPLLKKEPYLAILLRQVPKHQPQSVQKNTLIQLMENDISFCRPKLDWMTEKTARYIFQFLHSDEVKVVILLNKSIAFQLLADPAFKNKNVFSFPAHIACVNQRELFVHKMFKHVGQFKQFEDFSVNEPKTIPSSPKFVRKIHFPKHQFERISDKTIGRIASFLGKDAQRFALCCRSVAISIYGENILNRCCCTIL